MPKFSEYYEKDSFQALSPNEQKEMRSDFFHTYHAQDFDEDAVDQASEHFNAKYPVKGETASVWDKTRHSAKRFITEKSYDPQLEVTDPKFRADFGMKDSVAERAEFLAQHPKVGPEGFAADQSGTMFLKPGAAKNFGIDSKLNVPIDSSIKHNINDVRDLSGMSGEILGGAIGSGLTGPYGLVSGLLGAGAGASGGKYIQETFENMTGRQNKPHDQIWEEAKQAGQWGMAGEGLMRGGAPFARYLSGPNKTRDFTWFGKRGGVYSQVDPKTRELSELALKHDIRPTIGQATGRQKVLSFFQKLSHRVFGNPRETANAQNISKMNQGMVNKGSNAQRSTKTGVTRAVEETVQRKEAALNRLIQEQQQMMDSGISKNLKDIQYSLGKENPLIESQSRELIKQSANKFREDASGMYSQVDEILGGHTNVGTEPMKNAAQTILNKYPKSGDERVLMSGHIQKELQKILEMDSNITFAQAHNIRSELGRMAYHPEYAGSPLEHNAHLLKKAVDSAMESGGERMSQLHALLPGSIRKTLPNKRAIDQYRKANKFYADNMSRYENVEIQSLTRDLADGKGVENSEIIPLLMGMKSNERVSRVMKLLPEQKQKEIQRSVFERMVRESTGLDDKISGADMLTAYTKMEKLGTHKSLLGEQTPQIKEYLRQLSVRNGDFDPSILQKGGVRDALESQLAATYERDAYVKSNFVQLIKAGEFKNVVDTALQRENTEFTKQLMNHMTDNEKDKFRGVVGQQLSRHLFDTTTDPAKTLINANGFLKYVDDLTGGVAKKDNVLIEIYGEAHAKDIMTMAKMIKKMGGRELRGGLVENYLALHPIANMGRLMRLRVGGNILADKVAIGYFLNGMKLAGGVNVAGVAMQVPARIHLQMGFKLAEEGRQQTMEYIDKAIERATELALPEDQNVKR